MTANQQSPIATMISTLPQGQVHLATMADLSQIITIYNQAVVTKNAAADLNPVSEADRVQWLQAYINDAKRPLYVLKSDSGEIKAWCSFNHIKPRPAYHPSSEVSIYISENHQRQGIARQLLSWMLTQAPELDIVNITAWVLAHNKPSLALFESLGFEVWGRLPDICDMDGFTADVMILGKKLSV